MASYNVLVKPSVQKDLRGLPKTTVGRVYGWFEKLRSDPLPSQAVKLVGSQDRYRIRVGNYRIIYEFDKASAQVIIHYVRHRRDAYR